ncbi:MAG: SH3 domain-containing protein, partial [Clostridiaceae bacterium]|nr:SH3 domain-containing protein [Clostridiaceae bacterium]
MKKIFFVSLLLLFVLTACDDKLNTGEYSVTDRVYGVYSAETEGAGMEIHFTPKITEPIEVLSDIENDVSKADLPLATNYSEEQENKDKDLSGNQEDMNKGIVVTDNGEQVVAVFESLIPDTIVTDIRYNKYVFPKDYLLVTSSGANIREKPDSSAEIVGKAQYFEKVNLIAEVVGSYIDNYKSDRWYKVSFIKNNETRYGYIFAKLAQPRGFQFKKMVDAVERLKQEIEDNSIAYISNYKNSVGTAPLNKGRTIDDFGGMRHQAAPAYYNESKDSDFRYLSDGILVTILGENDSFYRIRTINFEG